jgi:predicted house-cleaning noncanonical NTP pyrophosphatase (MazG superfamily)
MRTFQFNKLVRDKIKGYYSTSGNKVTLKKLNKKEFLSEIKNKLFEELQELKLDNKKEILSEVADIQELIDCLLETSHIKKAEVVKEQREKNKKNGAFKNRDFIWTVEVTDTYEWVPYFLKYPNKYPEIKKAKK